MDSLGDRCKKYESRWERYFIPKIPILCRVDGRAFHTFTRKCEKPFDFQLINTMVGAAERVAEEVPGCQAFYHQSDEVTFLFLDDANIQTEQWFGGRQNKIESIIAALMTAHFNKIWSGLYSEGGISREKFGENPAIFDARAFQAPKEDIANIFLWRIRDWARNSLNMFCRSFFSDKQLNGKSAAKRRDMLHGIGQNWANLPDIYKNGTFWHRYKGKSNEILPVYTIINEFLFGVSDTIGISDKT